MTTVLQIIDRALEHIGIKAPGETTTADDAATGLSALQGVLDAFQLNGAAIVGLQQLAPFTPAAGAQTVTIGPVDCDITAAVPAGINQSSFFRVAGVDQPLLAFHSFEQYAGQADKAAQGQPYAAFYARSPTVGTLYLSPAADGLYALHLWIALDVVTDQATLALADTLTLPYGYRMWLEYAVAAELCPTFTRPPMLAAMMERRAQLALNKVKRGNFVSHQLSPRPEFMQSLVVE
jgi:hypothetical protein